MIFLVPLALLAAALVSLPLWAHRLRRGQQRPLDFPAAHLVPAGNPSSKQRSRFEDRGLLSVRALLLLALAMLGSSPLLRCERLSLNRQNNEAVSLVIVLDDSGSMNLRYDGESAFERGRKAALDLLKSTGPGDTITLVLAGKPARIVASELMDMKSVRRLVSELKPSERESDLHQALELSRSVATEGARRICVLSDFWLSSPLPPELEKTIAAPDLGLSSAPKNCALGRALSAGGAIDLEVACTGGALDPESQLVLRELDSLASYPPSGPPLAKIKAQEGQMRLPLPSGSPESAPRGLVLSLESPGAPDQNPVDDHSAVAPRPPRRKVLVHLDPEAARIQTGPSSVLELALHALDPELLLEPAPTLPVTKGGYEAFSAAFIDDPAGLTPEASEALELYLNEGGAALFTLGPRSQRAPLGSTFWPLSGSAPRFIPSPSEGAAKNSGRNQGVAFESWTELGAKERAEWTLEKGSKVLVSFEDGAPLLSERAIGKGKLYALSLPLDVNLSDLALRPAFLATLELTLLHSQRSKGRGLMPVGGTVQLSPEEVLTGPQGPMTSWLSQGERLADLPVSGPYQFSPLSSKKDPELFAFRAVAETTQGAPSRPSEPGAMKGLASESQVSIARELSWAALLLAALELLLRSRVRQKDASTATVFSASEGTSIGEPK